MSTVPIGPYLENFEDPVTTLEETGSGFPPESKPDPQSSLDKVL